MSDLEARIPNPIPRASGSSYMRALVRISNGDVKYYLNLLNSSLREQVNQNACACKEFFLFSFAIICQMFQKRIPQKFKCREDLLPFVEILERMTSKFSSHEKELAETSLLTTACLCLVAYLLVKKAEGKNTDDDAKIEKCSKTGAASHVVSKVLSQLKKLNEFAEFTESFKANELDEPSCNLLKIFKRLLRDDLKVHIPAFKETIQDYFALNGDSKSSSSSS